MEISIFLFPYSQIDIQYTFKKRYIDNTSSFTKSQTNLPFEIDKKKRNNTLASSTITAIPFNPFHPYNSPLKPSKQYRWPRNVNKHPPLRPHPPWLSSHVTPISGSIDRRSSSTSTGSRAWKRSKNVLEYLRKIPPLPPLATLLVKAPRALHRGVTGPFRRHFTA